MNDVVELEGVDLAAIEAAKAVTHVLEQRSQLLFVVGADDLSGLATLGALARGGTAPQVTLHARNLALGPLLVSELTVRASVPFKSPGTYPPDLRRARRSQGPKARTRSEAEG